MPFHRTTAILLAWGLMVPNVRAVIPDDLPRYRQGLRDFRAGLFERLRVGRETVILSRN